MGTAASILLGTTLLSLPAHAVIEFDQDVTPDAIFGSGNANGGFTTDRANGVEVGLRGKLRHNAVGAPENTFNSNGDGTYSFDAGVAPTQAFPTAVWSFEWSINTDFDDSTTLDLDDLTYTLALDSDPSQGVTLILFDPINDINPGNGLVFWDHSIGDNSTGNGGGTEAADATDYANLIANNNVAQNSWKPHWFIAPFDPTVDATYTFSLSAFQGDTLLASTSIDIIVGAGGAPVPEPATLALLGLGLAGLGAMRRRRR
jgi:hypothetical protein